MAPAANTPAWHRFQLGQSNAPRKIKLVFAHTLELGSNTDDALAQLPASRGVFAIFSHDSHAEPYISHSANLRRRLQRLLGAQEQGSRRLNLRSRAARVGYAATGSPLESLLLLYAAYKDPRQRLKLRPPPMLRYAHENAYPRVYLTTRLSLKAAEHFYGPFASRAQAESYQDALLDQFLLRRCQPDLAPDPAFPGCIYSEMHKCLAPCFGGCSDDRYQLEAEAVTAFLATRGESLLQQLANGREAASAALDFEQAAALHARFERAKAAAHLASELARPVSQLHAIVMERSAESDSVALFLFSKLQWFGPVEFRTLGMRHGNEQSHSSSLFVQPMLLAPVPLHADQPAVQQTAGAAANPSSLEDRLAEALELLLQQARDTRKLSSAQATDHLALLRRWFYRPESQKSGEIFFAKPTEQLNAESFPLRRMLRGVSRVATGQSASHATALQTEGLLET